MQALAVLLGSAESESEHSLARAVLEWCNRHAPLASTPLTPATYASRWV